LGPISISTNFESRAQSGSEFDGWCWPGSSAYLDFAVAAVRQYWASLFALDKVCLGAGVLVSPVAMRWIG
jgi:hypothetical protein